MRTPYTFAVASRLTALTTLTAGLAFASAARAAVVTTGGAAALGPAPSSVLLNATESNTAAPVFAERQHVTLASGLSVDISTAGLYDAPGDLTPAMLPAGMRVSSYYLFSDPVGQAQNAYEGFVVFDEPIIGIIVERPALSASDTVLGLAATTYGDFPARDLELGGDRVLLTVSTFRIDFRFSTSSAADHIRIVTLPAPGAAAAALMGMLAAARRRR